MHLTHEPSKFNMRQTVGCFLSHRKCWQHVVDHKLPYALILEDDALMTIEAAPFLEAYESNPLPFDWLKLHVHRHPNRVDAQRNCNVSVNGIQMTVDMAGSKSTAAYIITYAGAKKALRMKKLLAPVDHLEWLNATTRLVFVQASRNLFDVRDDITSTISNELGNLLLRLPAICRIGLIRLVVGRWILRKNLEAVIQTVGNELRDVPRHQKFSSNIEPT